MKTVVLAVVCLLSALPGAAAELVPTIANGGFEKGIEGWGWTAHNGARASWEISQKDPHSGDTCLVLRSESGVQPHVYGRMVAYVDTLPGTRYELSCWVRGTEVGSGAGSSHFTDWSTYTLNLPSGTFGWRKVATEFTTGPGQKNLAVAINITNVAKELAIDDVQLVPRGGQLQAPGLTGIILISNKIIGHDSDAPASILVENKARAVTLEADILREGRRISSKRFSLKRGSNALRWRWNTGNRDFGEYTLAARAIGEAGSVIAKGTANFEIVDSPVFAEIAKVEERKVEFDRLFAQASKLGIALDYPLNTKTMLEQMIPLAKVDVRATLEYRARYAVTDFNRALDEGIERLRTYLKDPDSAPVMQRYTTGRVDIEGLSFVGPRVDSDGKRDRGPLFFVGYGHFAQIRADMPRWPGYGVNLLQHSEFGPAQVFPKEDKVDWKAIRTLERHLDEAAKRNVRIDFLISPHYFPEWAMRKYPHLGKGGGGFFGYCVDDPAANKINEDFLRLVIPRIKDKPALHSICLSNEPVFPNLGGCDNTKELWERYLRKTHGDIATLNARYGTSHASFADVPYSGDAQVYDWVMCGMERFAGWHRWLADIIHEMAPDVPVHAKVMSNQLNAGQVNWVTDQERFGNLLDLNGNDCYFFPTHNPAWPADPWLQNTSYDIQRSFARKPVFNSENHIVPDGSTHYQAPEHFRAALWQGAIHGQGSTTIWVWERDFTNRWGFIGSVMERPGSAQAVGATCLDLNRLAEEVTALATVKAPVAIVYSMSSIIRRGNEHTGAIWRVYHALNHCGVKIDFISEKQLASGKADDYLLIISPEAETLRDDAFAGLRKAAKAKLLLIGANFARNEYGKKRDESAVAALLARGEKLEDGDAAKVLWPALRSKLAEVGGAPEYTVVDAKTNEPAWGLEWLPARIGDRWVVNAINFTGTPIDIKILKAGQSVAARDLLSLGEPPVTALKTLTPVLAEVR